MTDSLDFSFLVNVPLERGRRPEKQKKENGRNFKQGEKMMDWLHNQLENRVREENQTTGYRRAVKDYLIYCKNNQVSPLSALQQVYDIFKGLPKDVLKELQREVYDDRKQHAS